MGLRLAFSFFNFGVGGDLLCGCCPGVLAAYRLCSLWIGVEALQDLKCSLPGFIALYKLCFGSLALPLAVLCVLVAVWAAIAAALLLQLCY